MPTSVSRRYVRRFYRLYPPLLATLVLSLIAGWLILGPADYLALAQSALSAGLGVANFYFYTAVDYFNAASHSHYLLHTWSLSVEEQFYLFWPLMLLLARLWVGRIWLVAAVLAVGSFVTLQLIQASDPDLAFYMMPFRIFEFFVGAALIPLEAAFRRTPDWAHTVVGGVGVALLAFCLAHLNAESRWPGYWSLAVALATGMLILAGTARVWKAILGFPALLFVGRISYSLYLVHWPIITLYRHYIVTEPDRHELFALGLASLLAATILHVCIEEPFRRRRTASVRNAGALEWQVPRRYATGVLMSSLLGLLAFSGFVMGTDGVPSRLERSKAQFLDGGLTFAGDICSNRRYRCQIGDRESQRIVYIIGDSHALNLLYGLDRFFRAHKIKGIVFYDHGCLFVSGTKRFIRGAPDQECRRHVVEAYAHLMKTDQPVIVAGNYSGYRNVMGPADAATPVRQTETEYYEWLKVRLRDGMKMIRAHNRTVILVKQAYSTGINLPKCLARPNVSDKARSVRNRCVPWRLDQAQKASRQADVLIDQIGSEFSAIFVVDPKQMFCTDTQCTTSRDGNLLFRDTTHLTNAGSDFLIEAMSRTLLKSLAIH